MKYKHQIVLKNSKLDIGFGSGVLFEKELDLSDSTRELLESNDVVNAACDVNFLLEHVEVKMIKE